MTQVNSFKYHILSKLLCQQDLSQSEAMQAFKQLLTGGSENAAWAKAVLLLLREKGETEQELAGACLAIRQESLFLSRDELRVVDNCGTGGDGKGTFNISTVAAFVAAGAGAYVAKHGNRSISSKVGSADLLTALGVNIEAPAEIMLRSLRQNGFGFFFAPKYHPALGRIRSVRREIAGRTAFNLLGPLLNPLRADCQVIGVPDARVLRVMAKALGALNYKHVFIVCGEGNTDEVTPYGITRIAEFKGRKISFSRLNPAAFGIPAAKESDLQGGNLSVNVKIALGLLRGTIHGPKKNALLLNAALTLLAAGLARDFKEGLLRARASLDTGSAYRVLQEVIRTTNHGA